MTARKKFQTMPTLCQTAPIFERLTLLRLDFLHKRTNGKSSRADLAATQSHVDAQLNLESLYCNNTRLEMKGAQPPFQEYWGGYSPPSPPGSYAYAQSLDWTGGLTQTAVKTPFSVQGRSYSLKLLPQPSTGLFLKSVEVKGHMNAQ